MKSHKFFQRNLIVIILSILLGAASLIYLGDSESPIDPFIMRVRYAVIGGCSLLTLIISQFKIQNFPKSSLLFLLVWVLFSIVLVISGLANNDLNTVRDGFWFMMGIPLLFFNVLPCLMKDNASAIIASSLIFGHAPYIIISLLFYPMGNLLLYQGVFANSNQLGMTCAIVSAGIIILLTAAVATKKSTLYISLILLLLLGVFYLLWISKSRTSLIAFLVMLWIFFWRSFFKFKHLSKIIFGMTIATCLTILCASEQIQTVWRDVESVFLTKNNDGNFSGRQEIWSEVIENMNLFGHGYNYFELKFGLGGHNTVIDILGRNGIVAAYLMVFLAVTSFFYAYSYLKQYEKEDNYAAAPLIIITCFWILSMGEGLFGSLGNAVTLSYMLAMGNILMKPNYRKIQYC